MKGGKETEDGTIVGRTRLGGGDQAQEKAVGCLEESGVRQPSDERGMKLTNF